MHISARTSFVLALALVLGGVSQGQMNAAAAAVATRPNIVLILTDDQRFDSLFSMTNVRHMLVNQGVTFSNAFVTNSLCCPSRATILTGAYSHTTKVYSNDWGSTVPYGGWRAFHDTGDENGTIALALHDAGYETALVGKYLNHYRGTSVPPGWDRWAAFANTGSGGAYYNYSMYVRDAAGTRTESYGSARRDYSTTVIRRRSIAFLKSTSPDTPFFLYLAPFAPHGKIIPAPSDIGSFSGYRQHLFPSFDEADVTDKPNYIRSAPSVDKTMMEKRFRLQYEALQAVDRTVGSVVDYLRTSGQLANTLIVFMSDNGMDYGEHRWVYKLVPYDESIRVPFVVRYPALTGSLTGTESAAMVSNLDVAPTFADVAGIGDSFVGVGKVDGTSIVPVLTGAATSIRHDLLLEHLDYGSKFHAPTYCGLRTENLMYARYSDGFEEVYRLRKDPYELRNAATTAPTTLQRLRSRTRELCKPLPPEYTWP